MNRGQRAEEVQAFARRLGITFPLLLDQDASAYQKYQGDRTPRIAPFPRDVLVDGKGQVVYYSRIFEPEALREAIEQVLCPTGGSDLKGRDGTPDVTLWIGPNPAAGAVRIRFSLPTNSLVSLAIFDCRGREIVELAREYLPAGTHQLQWEGQGRQGLRLPSGVYVCRLQTSRVARSAKFVLWR